jgi:hypothetical protein
VPARIRPRRQEPLPQRSARVGSTRRHESHRLDARGSGQRSVPGASGDTHRVGAVGNSPTSGTRLGPSIASSVGRADAG